MSRRSWGGALAALLLALVVIAVPGTASAAPGPAEAPEWWFDSWNVPSLWAGGADGHGITVAVIDTGVDAGLPELQGKVLAGADFIGNGSDGRTDYDSEDFSHGTAMASIIVARRGFGDIEGLAPNARVLPLAVPLRGVVRKGTPTPNATATAIDYAADHGARIISMSLGGVSEESDGPDPCPPAVQAAVLHALTKGALVVAASGNSGDAGSPVEEPGVCLGVVSVGAVDRQLNVSPFSSRHPYLTVSAPGDKIPTLSRDSAYIGEGTSQATAMTSAALALIWSKYPSETNRQVLTRLLSTVTDRGTPGRDSAYGLGVIDPARAIAAKPAAGAANAVFDGVQPLLLAASAAAATTPKAIPAAGSARSSLGQFQVAGAPATVGLRFYLATVAAGVFALLAVLFLIIFVRRRPVHSVLFGFR
ncbi:MAG: S8 family serine peptidase [Actinomycetota bacterium]|nr:S8 family serine peptidase [Actinomycetota bacterium]MDQ2955599.1 S8 family serine peptidase [Actinomycetota bacterium]